MINVYKYLEKTNVEGPGQRFCIWVQGCKRHCLNCWAKGTWEFGIGKNYSVNEIFEKICKVSDIEGVTFLGGEPFEQAKDLSKLAKLIKQKGLSIVCFTGYTIEEIQQSKDKDKKALLNNIDLLIDGPFEQAKFDLSRPWIGSSNQRYHFLSKFYSEEIIDKYKNKIEVRIAKNGQLEINGMGDFNKIEKNFCLQLGKNRII